MRSWSSRYPVPRLLAMMLLALLLAGCGSGDGVLYQDQFESDEPAWETGEFVEGIVTYGNGVYAVTSYGGGNMMWGRLVGETFDNVDAQVLATPALIPANQNNSYGIGCRIQPNNDGYYLRISSDGYYAITKIADGVPIQLIDWAASPVIRKGAEANTLRAVCDGDRLEWYANGHQLAAVQDSAFQSGDIVLTATSFELEPTEIYFDNFIAWEPGATEG